MTAGRASGGGADVASRRRRIQIAAAVAFALAVLLGLKETRRVTSDGAFCASACHHAGEAGRDGHARGHEGVACQACHTTRVSTGLALLAESLTGSAQPRRHGKVEPQTCAGCHEGRPSEWSRTAETAGHRRHRGLPQVSCLSCHAATSHGDAPADKPCLDCHKAERIHPASAGPTAESCIGCHSFAASEQWAQKPTPVACETCHADAGKLAQAGARPMRDVGSHALHGDVACQLCHNPHGIKLRVPEGRPVCDRCHQIEIFQAGVEVKTSPEGHRACPQCHAPHAPKETALQSCVKCHEKNATAMASAGSSTALRHQSCASCHLPHLWRAERSGCMTCHADKTQLILTRSPPEHGSCTNCHEVHGPPPTGAVCVGCHAKTKGRHVALAPERHKDCTACHDPHSPSPSETRLACAKCHATELSGVMRDGPEAHAKNGCFGCHKPHENPLPPVGICGTCHTDKAALVATAGPERHRTCTSCHEKHRFSITDTAAACGTCHGPAAPGTTKRAPDAVVLEPGGPHRGDCRRCHTPHGPPTVPKAACFKCHEDVEAAFKPPNETHATCRSCHTPHTPASAAPARCPTCHTAQALVATRWPASSAHAGPCNGCHEPHDVRTKKPCATCHASEEAGLRAGPAKHQCTMCHAPHKDPPGTGRVWWAKCADCHAGKVESVKSRGPTHADCKNCHKPHEFALPACTSCHAEITKRGMHVVKTHAASCTKCHDPHVRATVSPPQCLACHTERKNHEPTAQKCQACHLFE